MALIGKNNHESVLDENASLFQPQDNKSEKQKWREMDKQQKLRYFKDYYLWKYIICIAVVLIIISFIWNMLKPHKEQLLFIAVDQNSLIAEDREKLEQALSELFISDLNTQEIRVDDTFPPGYEADAKLTAYLSAQEIDLIITTETHFQQLAKISCFEDLYEAMPDFAKKYDDLLCWAEGYEYKENTAEEDTSQNFNNELIKAYGIDITNTEIFADCWPSGEKAVLGIVKNSRQKENAELALTEIFFK